MDYIIYTDGSDLKHTSHRLGCGGLLLNGAGEELDRFSEELSHDYMRKEFGTTDCSNPTAEMIGVLRALEAWGPNFKKGDKVEFCQDYIGCGSWVQGKWQAKKPYIKKITLEIQKKIKELGIDTTWTWVQGHQSGSKIKGTPAYYNNIVDQLAKGK